MEKYPRLKLAAGDLNDLNDCAEELSRKFHETLLSTKFQQELSLKTPMTPLPPEELEDFNKLLEGLQQPSIGNLNSDVESGD